MTTVRKAIFPVAGLGTRFLPATKAVPKEMLPIVDVPQIQVTVQEAIDSGIEEIIFITGRGKVSVVDHFDVACELEMHLRERGQRHLLGVVEEIAQKAQVVSIRQKKPLGLGHAVLCAQKVVGNEPFAVVLSDDIIKSETPCVLQLKRAFEEHDASMVAAMQVAGKEISKYGVVIPAEESAPAPRVTPLRGMVEKPPAQAAPSKLAIIGRYVLHPEIFDALKRVKPDVRGEIQLTDGLRLLLGERPVCAYEFEGIRYDAGDKLGFLQATVEFALDREDIGPVFREYLRSLKI